MTGWSRCDGRCWPAKQNTLALLPFISNKYKTEKTIEDTVSFFTFNKPFQVLIKAM